MKRRLREIVEEIKESIRREFDPSAFRSEMTPSEIEDLYAHLVVDNPPRGWAAKMTKDDSGNITVTFTSIADVEFATITNACPAEWLSVIEPGEVPAAPAKKEE